MAKNQQCHNVRCKTKLYEINTLYNIVLLYKPKQKKIINTIYARYKNEKQNESLVRSVHDNNSTVWFTSSVFTII